MQFSFVYCLAGIGLVFALMLAAGCVAACMLSGVITEEKRNDNNSNV